MPAPRSDVPILTTERLVLREHRPSDFDSIAELLGDIEVVRYITGKPIAREDAWMRFLRNIGHWQLLGFGMWIVVDRTSGLFLGVIGLGEFRRDGLPQLGSDPEVGWLLTPAAQGRGLATEAVTAAVAWAAEHFGSARRLVCIIDPRNDSSLSVAKKCGFERFGTAVYHGETLALFERRSVSRSEEA